MSFAIQSKTPGWIAGPLKPSSFVPLWLTPNSQQCRWLRAPLQARSKGRRLGFTLLELILAVALGATLLALIGAAINLYLLRVDADRSRVEEAQLARSVLAMITDDIREASVYQKQDTSAIAQLMAAGTPFDAEEYLDAARTTGGTNTPGGAATIAKLSALSSSSSDSGASGSGGAGTSGSGSSAGSNLNNEGEDTMPLGLNGTQSELWVDVTRLPKQEDLFATVTGYTNAPSAASQAPSGTGTSATSADVIPPADLKTVHYFVRAGNAVASGSAAVTSLAPEAQAAAGGLVRSQVSRRERLFSEQNGGSAATGANDVLVAPEVTQLVFRYYDGSQLTDTWDMREQGKLPLAIEVSVWFRSSRIGTAEGSYNSADAVSASRMYRQVVYLMMSPVSEASAMNGSSSSANSTTSETSSTGTDSSSTGAASGTGSAFDNQ